MDDTTLTVIWMLGIVPVGALLGIKISMDRGKRPKATTKKKEVPKPEPPKETLVPIKDAPKKFPFELVREIAGHSKPIVVKRVPISNKTEVKQFRLKPLARAYFIRSIIKREQEVPNYVLGFIRKGTKKKVDFVARCNLYWSESLESLEESIPKYSRELENLLLSDNQIQFINGVASLQKFRLDDTTIKLMFIVFGMAIPFGLLFIAAFHIIPSQIVVWSP